MGAEPELLVLPADGRAASLARAAVRDRLRGWGLDGLTDVVVLLTSELVANVVVHTGSAPGLRLDRDGPAVRVTVRDASPVLPQRRRHSALATTGRGLDLVADLADDWGWAVLGDGKEVWFRVGGSPAADRSPAGGPDPRTDGRISPLGRYAPPDGAGADADRPVAVRLLGVPVRVLLASREHHDGLLREFRLLAMSGAMDRGDAPARLADLTRELGVRYAAARARPDADVNRAVERGLDTVDLTYSVPPAAVDGARQMQSLLDEADVFCRSGQLITLPRTPAVRQFARWYVDQFVQQIAGHPATRWDGPLDP